MNDRGIRRPPCRVHQLSLLCLVVLFATACVDAHPTTAASGEVRHANASGPSRLWHDSDSGETVRGRFLSFHDDVVRIERENGEIVSFHLHDLVPDDRAAAQTEIDRIRALNRDSLGSTNDHASPTSRPSAALPFDVFAPSVRTRWDEKFLYVESNGMPSHPMMIGIRAWQQQVPLPQAYQGDNAWRIPLAPVPAVNPLSAKENFFRGAIALAANGVPIFNPIKNDGRTDTYIAGELDDYGGHSGRADDYHYHIAPLHLQKALGPDLPIAYALDGYPIYGLLDGKPCSIAGDIALDSLNGHADAKGQRYHYHASKTYPYINGGMHGEVTVEGGQIDPQPRAEPARPSLTPLRGAKITGFSSLAAQSWKIEYTIGKDRYTQSYRIAENGDVVFETTGPDGKPVTQTFPAKVDGHRRPPPGNETNDESKRGEPPPRGDSSRGPRKPWFVVHAPEMDADKNGILTTEEVLAEVDKTFAGYDANQDGKVSADETRDPVHSVLGGFVKEHFKELADGEPATKEDVRRVVMHMFDKQDANHNGKLDADELKDRPR